MKHIGSLRPAILTELSIYLTEDTMEANRIITYKGNPWTYPILFVAEGEVEIQHKGKKNSKVK